MEKVRTLWGNQRSLVSNMTIKNMQLYPGELIIFRTADSSLAHFPVIHLDVIYLGDDFRPPGRSGDINYYACVLVS